MAKNNNNWIWIVLIVIGLMYFTETGFFKKQGLPNGSECELPIDMTGIDDSQQNFECSSGWCKDIFFDSWFSDTGECAPNPYGTPGGETATQLSIEQSKIKQLSDVQMIPYTCTYSSECADKDASCTSLKVLEQKGFLPKTAAGITGTIDNVISGAGGGLALCGIIGGALSASFILFPPAGLISSTVIMYWKTCAVGGALAGGIFTKISNWFNERPDDIGLCVKEQGMCIAGISNIMEKIGLNMSCQTNTIIFFAAILFIFMMFMMMGKR